MSSYKCVVGDIVSFRYNEIIGTGVVKFVGSLLPSKKGLWVGIERDMPKAKVETNETQDKPEGYNGKVGDMKYFTVKKGRGMFVPYDSVQVIADINKDETKTTQTELTVVSKAEKEYSPVEDQKIQSADTNNTKQQLQKAQQLLEASLLLLQSGGITNKSKIQTHCEESWKFLNKKCPQSIAMHHNITGDGEEKFAVRSDNKVAVGDISIGKMKEILTDFMTMYSKADNWKKSEENNYGQNIDSYVWVLDGNRSIEVRMSFLYSIMLYFIQISGANKRCIAHGTLLFLLKKQQIETLSSEMAMILETLQFNNDDGLWKYVYSMISKVFEDFAYIEPYSGKRIELEFDGETETKALK